ncbi:MAG: hypothetical protein GY847_11915 [Proteobacteria bacterium]|nr:hypothetical protein [Pseudomonadota bacterium]
MANDMTEMASAIAHDHVIVTGAVGRPKEVLTDDLLLQFLRDTVDQIEMKILIEPTVVLGPYGHTGIVGIVTSHMAFHFFHNPRTLQFDVYSCKSFSVRNLYRHLADFWMLKSAAVIFINRTADTGPLIRHYRGDATGNLVPSTGKIESCQGGMEAKHGMD